MLHGIKPKLVDRTVQQMLCIAYKNLKKLVQAIFTLWCSIFLKNRLIEIMEVRFLVIYFRISPQISRLKKIFKKIKLMILFSRFYGILFDKTSTILH